MFSYILRDISLWIYTNNIFFMVSKYFFFTLIPLYVFLLIWPFNVVFF